MRTISVIVGTRPEAIKMAPVILELQAREDVDLEVVSSGQHQSMLESALALFGISVNVKLDTFNPGQTLASLGASLLREVSAYIAVRNPEYIFVHGDTSTAFFSALSAFYCGVKIVHVEAGLRSGSFSAPFPEEMNRVFIGELATLHLAPTKLARENLLSEGVAEVSIKLTGNTIVDAVRQVAEKLFQQPKLVSEIQSQLAQEGLYDLESAPFAIITLHRRENHGPILENYLDVLGRLATENPDFTYVFPVHPNPSVRSAVHQKLSHYTNVKLTSPIDYIPFVWLLSKARFIITDSGGIQEEAATLGVPLLLCRTETERPEAIESNLAWIVGHDYELLYRFASDLTDKAIGKIVPANRGLNLDNNPFGKGNASSLSVSFVLDNPEAI